MSADPVTDDPVLDQRVRLHQLTFLVEGDDVTVGRPDTESYAVLPADGAELLRRLVDGLTPRAASRWYLERYGEPVDVAEFLATLGELGFVAERDDEPVERAPVRWQRLGRAVFSPPAWIGYAVVVLAAIVVVARQPDLAPRYGNLFFNQYMSVTAAVLFAGQVPLILLHELFHVLAGRRIGVRSRLSIGRRLYFVVFETAMDGLVGVPRKQRYLPILAGVLCDVLVLCGFTLCAAGLREPGGGLDPAGRLCLALAFSTLLRLVWQAYFYLRTDLYLLVTTVLGCIDLDGTARRMLGNKVNRVLGRERRYDEADFHPLDRRAARWYQWLCVVGYAFSLGTAVFAMVPATVHVFVVVLTRFGAPHAGLGGLADSTVFLVLTVGQLALVGYLAVRDRRRVRRTRSTASTATPTEGKPA